MEPLSGKIIGQKITLPLTGRSVRMFTGGRSLMRHLCKHVLSEGGERRLWARVLPLDAAPWNVLNQKKLSRILECQVSAPDDVCLIEALNGACASLAAYCGEGVRYSSELPVYAELVETFSTLTRGKNTRKTWYFVSKDGATIVVWGGALRTVFMMASCRGDSRFEVYWQALRNVRMRALQVNKKQRWRSENENAWVMGVSAELVREENFTKAENPWSGPVRKKPFTSNSRRLERREHIQKIETEEL